MINIITMKTVACLRSKCHLKQNLILSWPWSFWHTCLHFRFPVQNKIHKKNILSDTRTGILGSFAGPCDFLPARSAKFQKVCHTSWIFFTHLLIIRAIFKEFMHHLTHKFYIFFFQFTGKCQILTCINSLKITYIPIIWLLTVWERFTFQKGEREQNC